MGIPLLPTTAGVGFFFLIIMLSYPVILEVGAQSITADRNTRRSIHSNKYKRVKQ